MVHAFNLPRHRGDSPPHPRLVLGMAGCIRYRWGMSRPFSILLIGGGNMGAALARCWRDTFDDCHITIAETNSERRAVLAAQGFDAPDELEIPADGFDVVVLAIKPQTFTTLAQSLPAFIGEATLVSIMAGVPLAALQHITPHAARVMPNTPALIGEGLSLIHI